MFFHQINCKLKHLIFAAFLITSSFAEACEAESVSSMITDNQGNSYAVWSTNRIPQASIKPAASATWSPSSTLFSGEGIGTSIAGTDDGKVIVAWIGATENPSQYAIFVSMYVSSSWTTAFAITDPTESILNRSFDMTIINNPTSGNTEMNLLWLSYYNSQMVMRTNTGIFGDNSNWTGPTNLP